MPSMEFLSMPDNAYTDGAVTIKAEKQLELLADIGKPFFMAIGYEKPHLPFIAPKKYWDLYKKEQISVAEFQKHAEKGPSIAYHASGELRQYTDIPEWCSFSDTGNLRIDVEKQRELIHAYYACVSYIDAQIGKLLIKLEKLNLLNNTIIVFWGDHGWHLGDHGLWNKHSNFEQATKVPLIFYSPNIQPGKSPTLAELVDVYPTLCDLTGINIPFNIDGVTLVPAMKDKSKIIHEYVVSQYPRSLSLKEMKKKKYKVNNVMGYSIRTTRYRYTVWMHEITTKQLFDDKKIYAEELYDYKIDFLERKNLIGEVSHSTKNKLKSMLLSFWEKEYNQSIK